MSQMPQPEKGYSRDAISGMMIELTKGKKRHAQSEAESTKVATDLTVFGLDQQQGGEIGMKGLCC